MIRRTWGAYLNFCDRFLPGYSRPDPDAGPEYADCERCEEEIKVDATTCPECDNCPYKSAKWSAVGLMIGGLLLSLTVVGAIIGVPLFIVGLLVRLGASNLSPTEHDFA